MKYTHNTAFSLLELSIVLVIIGLIAGGIVAGASMIRAAELRAVITEKEQFESAINTFRDKYLGLPGDLKNAVRFWGAAAGGTADGFDTTCSALDHTSPSTGTETCNGDGDGWIQDSLGSTAEVHERFRAWQHLANAELISGNYTGVQGASGTWHYIPGENGPASKLNPGVWTLSSYSGALVGSANLYDISGMMAMEMRDNSTSSYELMSTEEAWNIDAKIDDGKPGLGKVGGYKPNKHPNCATTDVNNTAEYNLTYEGSACSLIFFLKGSYR